jgi:hypothetical protein
MNGSDRDPCGALVSKGRLKRLFEAIMAPGVLAISSPSCAPEFVKGDRIMKAVGLAPSAEGLP